MVKAGQFRDDLYYRLNTAAIFLPPLRERREAISAFIAHFIEHYNRLFGKEVLFVDRHALDYLLAYGWPGNVRELAHAIESAVILSESECLIADDLPAHILEIVGNDVSTELADSQAVPAIDSAAAPSAGNSNGGLGPLLLDEVIKRTLLRSLEETDGNRRRAADLLGVSRSTLYRMLARYGISENAHPGSAQSAVASDDKEPGAGNDPLL